MKSLRAEASLSPGRRNIAARQRNQAPAASAPAAYHQLSSPRNAGRTLTPARASVAANDQAATLPPYSSRTGSMGKPTAA